MSISIQWGGLPRLLVVKNLPANAGDSRDMGSVFQEDPLEEGMTTHSRILVWRIPWTEDPGGLQSVGSLRVGHDWCDSTHTRTQNTHTHTHNGVIGSLSPSLSLCQQSQSL